jgi:hypothetical protein
MMITILFAEAILQAMQHVLYICMIKQLNLDPFPCIMPVYVCTGERLISRVDLDSVSNLVFWAGPNTVALGLRSLGCLLCASPSRSDSPARPSSFSRGAGLRAGGLGGPPASTSWTPTSPATTTPPSASKRLVDQAKASSSTAAAAGGQRG